MIAYLGFVKRNPELHNDSKFKMPGGKYMAYAILASLFIFIVLLIMVRHVLRTIRAVWAIVLVIMYQKYRKNLKATIAMEDEKI